MPQRHQLNVNIQPELLKELKNLARRKGMAIGEFITELISKELAGEETMLQEFTSLKERIRNLESEVLKVKNSCPGQDETCIKMPFTQQETYNYTQFIRAVFKEAVKKNKVKSQLKAWTDFEPHLYKFENWTPELSLRLRDIMLFEEPEPWTAEELNKLSNNKKSQLPIREALISWAKLKNMPDQQTICNEGEVLLGNVL